MAEPHCWVLVKPDSISGRFQDREEAMRENSVRFGSRGMVMPCALPPRDEVGVSDGR